MYILLSFIHLLYVHVCTVLLLNFYLVKIYIYLKHQVSNDYAKYEIYTMYIMFWSN